MKISFKNYLLNENRAFLGEKINDVMTAIDDLSDDGAHMGARQLTKFAEKIVSRIRRILHSDWPQSEQKYLKTLQKVGVALMRGIEEKDQDLKEILPAVQQELQALASELGVPVNQLGAETGEDLPKNPPPGKKPKEDKDNQDNQQQQPPEMNMGDQGPQGPQMSANPADFGGPPPMPPGPPPPMAGPPM